MKLLFALSRLIRSMHLPFAMTKLMLWKCCPRWDWKTQGQEFCQQWKSQFFAFKIYLKWLFINWEWVFKALESRKSGMTLDSKKVNFLVMDKIFVLDNFYFILNKMAQLNVLFWQKGKALIKLWTARVKHRSVIQNIYQENQNCTKE